MKLTTHGKNNPCYLFEDWLPSKMLKVNLLGNSVFVVRKKKIVKLNICCNVKKKYSQIKNQYPAKWAWFQIRKECTEILFWQDG